ncbi:flagellar biosynthesis protein FlgJ [Chromobacterium sp. ATCC 53434]|uniref:flagellar biosynthesis protein FlgJ n=1 Tax=Chromobacterium sp. (strain ATCC 53434 / SC 14030) TaxID=2059672 RepID=UPI000C776519|nr:flagellar biosynthesis protein FlgJ [Chromobacterium sp. ATCC 53434]AUH51822.1 flagellar biosynthesis protein FlgJ [Chromobacterium sp. ATCC 53434]
MLNNDLQNPAPDAGGDGAVAPANPEYRKQAQKAAELFEAQFAREMFKQMRKTTREVAGEDSIFAHSINTDMLEIADGALADQLAGRHVFGIADAILTQLLPADGNITVKDAAGAVASLEKSRRDGQGLAAFATPMFPLSKR